MTFLVIAVVCIFCLPSSLFANDEYYWGFGVNKTAYGFDSGEFEFEFDAYSFDPADTQQLQQLFLLPGRIEKERRNFHTRRNNKSNQRRYHRHILRHRHPRSRSRSRYRRQNLRRRQKNLPRRRRSR